MIPDVAAIVEDLVERLEDAAPAKEVYGYVPEEPTVPAFVIQGSQDVIQVDDEGTMRGEYLVTLDVVILVELDGEHDNEDATHALWASLQELAAALEDSDWTLERVTQPTTLQTLYWQHHGVTATVRTRTE